LRIRTVSLPAWLTVALMVLAGLILHATSLTAPFFADDYLFLDQVRLQSLPDAMGSADPLGNFFRPVSRQLHFWVFSRLGNESPLTFHLVNLALFSLAVALLFFIVRRLAGSLAAATAAGILALSYAADIPIRWASGSQDLWALATALAALLLYLHGRGWWAGLCLLLALLSKETVVFTPLIAVLLGRSGFGSWRVALRQSLPLWIAGAIWLALWFVTMATRAPATETLNANPLGILAAASQLLRVLLGLEWRTAEFGRQLMVLPPLLALLPVVLAVFLIRVSSQGEKPALLPALAGWSLLAALPIAVVAATWSAYYYLFALAGLAALVGWAVHRQPRWVAAVVLVIAGWSAQAARQVDEFASGPGYWTAQSHVNLRYYERATTQVATYLGDLKRQQPRVPATSTFFFSNIPGFIAWQSGDGPLVRWAYRDTSLRSYYLADITAEKARRGPRYFFMGHRDRLVEWQETRDELMAVATGMTLAGREEQAREVLDLILDEAPRDTLVHYRLAWLEWAAGDSTRAAERLDGLGLYGLDPAAHYALALFHHADGGDDAGTGVFEALAARALAPESAEVWGLWARYQWQADRVVPAVRSIEHYLELGGDASDPEIQEIMAEGEHYRPGSKAIQRGLRE
jgi:hypothetical protein